MKKIAYGIVFMLVLAAALVTFAAADPLFVNDLPAEINALLPNNGSSAVEGAALTGTGKTDYWFVLTEDSSRVLYCFRNTGKGWKEYYHTSKAVPQGKNYLEISMLETGVDDPMTGLHYKGPVLAMWLLDSQYPDQSTGTMMTAYYRLIGQNWSIVRYVNNSTGTSAYFGDDFITYYKKPDSAYQSGTAYGTIQRNLRYISLDSTIPKTYADAEKGLTFAPVLPAGSDLRATEVEFTGGKKYEVYSGPGKNTIRGGNGKAAVSTNGWIQVFGQENGWVMIQYSIDNTHYRIGYIDAVSLPKDANVGYLYFNSTPVSMLNAENVTDDPLYSRNTLTSVSAGTQVTWLATMGEWAYIDGGTFRGFVPLYSIVVPNADAGQNNNAFFSYTAEDGQQYDLFEIRKMHYDASRHVYAVSGNFERITDEYGEAADNGRSFTFNLSGDFSAKMIESMSSGNMNEVTVSDLYSWYVNAYLEGQAPQGEMTFMYDYPEGERADANADFWFVTVRIALNEMNEIKYMEYVYVPWA